MSRCRQAFGSWWTQRGGRHALCAVDAASAPFRLHRTVPRHQGRPRVDEKSAASRRARPACSGGGRRV